MSVLHGLIKYNLGVNLGDVVQSIAAAQFIDPVIYFDRDLPSHTVIPPGLGQVSLIMNAYWSGWDGKNPTWLQEMPLDARIKPLWISSHFDGGCTFTPEIIAYLKRFEPIGCRDNWSLKKIQALGIDAYFSNCLTITLTNTTPDKRGDDIYIVDIPKDVYSRFPEEILDNATFLTHNSVWAKDNIKRGSLYKFDEAQLLLEKYMSAKLVITSRLHCATPCLAFNTPVVFIGRKETFYRVNCLEEYIPIYSFDDFGGIDWCINSIKSQINYHNVEKTKKLLKSKINNFLK